MFQRCNRSCRQQRPGLWSGRVLRREIALWFKPEEIAEWTPVAKSWIYE